MKPTSILTLLLALASSACGTSATHDTASTTTESESSGDERAAESSAAPSAFEITLNGAGPQGQLPLVTVNQLPG